MSSETIVTALFLISAVIAAGVLINAIFPAIYRTADTFGSVSSQADTEMRTDFKIVNTYAKDNDAKIWLKNVGSARLHTNEVNDIEIFIGAVGNFDRLPPGSRTYTIEDNTNSYWDPGETLTFVITDSELVSRAGSGGDVYLSIVVPNGVSRTQVFTKS